MEGINKVLVSDPLSKKGLEILERAKNLEYDLKIGLSPEKLKKIIPEYDGIVIRSEMKLKADIIEAGVRLKVIGRAGIGLDNVDLPAATKKGVVVMNTPQENAIAAAEHTIAMVLSISRKIPQATASMKAGKWEKKKALHEGNWYEPAEIFRRWVTNGPWCGRGKLYDRVNASPPTASRWLTEEVGFASFGLACDAPFSRRAFTGMAKVADIPVFHVLAYDWSSSLAGMPVEYFGDLDTYSPPTYDQQTIAALRQQGDRYAPFVFDFFYNRFDQRGSLMFDHALLDGAGFRWFLGNWHWMCSQSPVWVDFHAERDRRHIQWGASASYYDI